MGSELRVAAAASTPGPSATRVGRSGAERAVAASPPRTFSGLPAPPAEGSAQALGGAVVALISDRKSVV